MNAVLNILFRSSVLCGFGSEMSASVTISNRLYYSGRGKEFLLFFCGALYYGIGLGRNVCDFDLFFCLSMKQKITKPPYTKRDHFA